MERKPLGKWAKRIIIALIIAALVVLCGSLVLYLGSYILIGVKTFVGWLAVGVRWLAKILDFFHFTGIFGG